MYSIQSLISIKAAQDRLLNIIEVLSVI